LLRCLPLDPKLHEGFALHGAGPRTWYLSMAISSNIGKLLIKNEKSLNFIYQERQISCMLFGGMRD
jgi:hypothetical protein